MTFVVFNPYIQGYVNLAYSHKGFLVHSRLERSNTGKSGQDQKVTTDYQEKKRKKKSAIRLSKGTVV